MIGGCLHTRPRCTTLCTNTAASTCHEVVSRGLPSSVFTFPGGVMINLQIDKQHGLLGSAHRRLLGGAALTVIAFWLGSSAAANAFEFTPGDLVIDTVSGTTLNSASPMTLQQFSLGAGGTTATSAGSLTLPQTGSGPISGEYGSASEGFLTQSVNGQYLAIMGYGVNASTFNAPPPGTNYGTTALGRPPASPASP